MEPSKKQVLQIVIRHTLPRIVGNKLNVDTIQKILADTPSEIKSKLRKSFGNKWRDLSFSNNDIESALSTAFILSDEMSKEWEREGVNTWKRRSKEKVKKPAQPRTPEDTSFLIPVKIRFVPKEITV